MIDYDALAKQDNEKWVQKGLNCLYPGNGLCLVALSAGGEDATTLREFDLKTGNFVDGGFVLPKSKQWVAWVDKDTLLVARDWGAGTMTKSGYPFVVKLWKRGEPLDEAKEIFRGAETDQLASIAQYFARRPGPSRGLSDSQSDFLRARISLLTPDGPKRVALPGKVELNGMLDGQVIVTLNQDWTPAGHDDDLRAGLGCLARSRAL